jgi:hypothetical protein
MADNTVDAPIAEDEEQAELPEFDPALMPLGTFAAFDVSDEPMWTTKEGPRQISSDYKNAIKAMVDAAGAADPVARRIEVQGAWMLELLDRGLHNIKPTSNSGWEISGAPGVGRYQSYGIYGANCAGSWHSTNVIGEKNDTLVACLTREVAESKFVPETPGDPDDEVYADTADSMRHFIADENKYGKRQGEVARFYCTDERALSYTRPVADAQRWGYEDQTPDVVPETADGLDPDAGAGSTSKRPKIRAVTTIFGKLSHKCPMMAADQTSMQYQMLCFENDVALSKAKYPWIEDQIQAGDLGIAQLKLDRLARQSIRLAMQASFGTGDGLARDVTETYVWFRPGFYIDDSCPKECRSWFWTNFPKGMLVVYAAGALAFVRNESMDETLNIFHARTGNGQNRRALTESYSGPQMRLNTLVDLRDEFCRKTIPRTGLDADAWNVPALRASSVRVGALEPFKAPVGRPAADTVLPFPVATGTPDIAAFIDWLAGPLAEQLTHATQGIAGSQDGSDPEQTAEESRLKQNNAMSSFGESWKDICEGFATIDTQAVAWIARVLPDSEKFDSNFSGKGRIQAEVAKLKMGSGKARAAGDANFPQSWAEREAAWDKALTTAEANPQGIAASIVSNPMTMAGMKEFLPKGMEIPEVDAVEKQQAEFDILLRTAPVDNPQFLQAQQMVQKLTPILQAATQEAQMMAATGQQMPPDKMQMLQQAQQMLQQAQQAMQTLPPMISSVPVLPTDHDATEALVCDKMINGAIGRRFALSKDSKAIAAFQNLNLHFQTHTQNAKQKALQNQQPVQPKTSITVDASKLVGVEQDSALQKLGIAADPAGDAPPQNIHEMTTKEKGVGPSGSEIERTVSVSGKPLN